MQGGGGRIAVDDLGLITVARGYVCDGHALDDAGGVLFTARVTAPSRLGRELGATDEALRRAAAAVARERVQARLRAGAFVRDSVYKYVVTVPRTSPPLWRALPG